MRKTLNAYKRDESQMFASYKRLKVFVRSYHWMRPLGTTTTIPVHSPLRSRLWRVHLRSSWIATRRPRHNRRYGHSTSLAFSVCAEGAYPHSNRHSALSASLLTSVALLSASSIHDYVFNPNCNKPFYLFKSTSIPFDFQYLEIQENHVLSIPNH